MTTRTLPLPDSTPLNSAGRGVALVAMPLLRPQFPSLAVGLLKAALRADGVPCDDLLFYLDFAEAAGDAKVQTILDYDPIFAGDYVFSGELDPPGLDEEAFVRQAAASGKLHPDVAEPLTSLVRHFRREVVPGYLDRLVAGHDWERYELVGFTSTFQQQTASLALARRLKARYPRLPVVIGGANLWGEMGRAWLARSPQLDYVCTAEGDQSLPELVRALRAGRPADEVPNISCRRDGIVKSGPDRTAAVAMNDLPYPDYATYFKTAARLRMQPAFLPFETSRGCWWGQKHHCVFCSNNSEMTFRSKSPERVHAELAALSRAYRVRDFYAVDNILDRRYIPTLFRRLDDEGSDLTFFFEVKSNLRLDEIRQLARGGVTDLQPGIESLSTNLLRAMRKGVTGIQNVFLLKWARYFGIRLDWNILSGFAGERAEDYDRQAAWIPLLHHLAPPTARIPVVVQRFAPLFERPEAFGITRIEPDPLYRVLYPGQPDLDRIAYFFIHDADGRLPAAAFANIDAALAGWKAARDRGADLTYYRSPAGFIEISDTREAGRPRRFKFESPSADLYELAGQSLSTPDALAEQLSRAGTLVTRAEVADGLANFAAAGLAVREGELCLPLAVPVGRRLFDRAAAAVAQPAVRPAPPGPVSLTVLTS